MGVAFWSEGHSSSCMSSESELLNSISWERLWLF